MCPIFNGCEDTAVGCLKSPELTPVDFCLWGWMKSEVYKEEVSTRDELVARIMNSAALKARTPRRPQDSYTYY
jgi:hypothetical protein